MTANAITNCSGLSFPIKILISSFSFSVMIQKPLSMRMCVHLFHHKEKVRNCQHISTRNLLPSLYIQMAQKNNTQI